MGGLIELKVDFLGWNGLRIVCIFFIASCGIPFQVLPDYQEGAEQVSKRKTLFIGEYETIMGGGIFFS